MQREAIKNYYGHVVAYIDTDERNGNATSKTSMVKYWLTMMLIEMLPKISMDKLYQLAILWLHSFLLITIVNKAIM